MRHAAASRDDMSPFVVHLTRDYDGDSAISNLVSMLDDKVIYARTAHCLFNHLIEKFKPSLQEEFKTVCFTETPLTQIERLVTKVPGKKIELEPYGLVFQKETVLEKGASPAIYINAKGVPRRDYLVRQFRQHFANADGLVAFKKKYPDDYEAIIWHYSLMNVMRAGHDFAWEREWRFKGDFEFKYFDLVAIIAPAPGSFDTRCKKDLSARKYSYIKRVPIISAKWRYSDIVEAMSAQAWSNVAMASKPKA
jgi:hypothetical protein